MAIFNSKDEKPEPRPNSGAKGSKEAISSVISKEMHIQGEIAFKGKARLDGTVEGDINGENLILSDSGKVKGDLRLTSLVCHGSVEGTIDANLITVHSSASIQGKLTAANLTVEPGARLSGEINTASSSQQTQAGPSPTAASNSNGKKVGQEK